MITTHPNTITMTITNTNHTTITIITHYYHQHQTVSDCEVGKVGWLGWARWWRLPLSLFTLSANPLLIFTKQLCPHTPLYSPLKSWLHPSLFQHRALSLKLPLSSSPFLCASQPLSVSAPSQIRSMLVKPSQNQPFTAALPSN